MKPRGEVKQDKYIGDMLQEDDNDKDDNVTSSFTSDEDKYKVVFRYKDFNVELVYPALNKPLLDKTKTVDLIFELLINRVTHFFFLASDEGYKKSYKAMMEESSNKKDGGK